jgi:hypothetical protein
MGIVEADQGRSSLLTQDKRVTDAVGPLFGRIGSPYLDLDKVSLGELVARAVESQQRLQLPNSLS